MKRLFWIFSVILIAGCIAILFFPATAGCYYPSKFLQARLDIQTIINAVMMYSSEYGAPPAGGNEDILKQLQGSNPKRICFLELDPKRLSVNGVYFDPWGSQYIFDLSKGRDSWAYSFGKNKMDEGGTGDDVASWKE